MYSNSKTLTVLKVLCIYYVLQILVVHIYLFLNLSSIQGKPDPIINETVHRVTKIVTENQTRDDLTDDQMDKIEEEMKAFQPIQKLNYTDIMIQIQDNLSKIVTQRAQLEEDLKDVERDVKDLMEPVTASRDDSMERIVPEMNQLLRLLKLDTYVQESDVQVRALQRDIKEELSAISPDQSYDFDHIFQVSNTSSDFDCSSFLNRVRKVRGNYVTLEELDNYMDGLKEELKRVQKEPLSLQDKEIILNNCDFEALFDEAKRNIENQIIELMDTIDGWTDEMDDSCVTKDEVDDLIKVGMQSLYSQEALYSAMQVALGDLDSEAKLERLIVDDDNDDKDMDEHMTLRSLIETPLYPKLIESIDSIAEFIVGYNDFIDQMIDKMGQGHDGRVGRVFEKYINRLCRMIHIPHQLKKRRKLLRV
jgi:hypothetical protein